MACWGVRIQGCLDSMEAVGYSGAPETSWMRTRWCSERWGRKGAYRAALKNLRRTPVIDVIASATGFLLLMDGGA